MRTPGTLGVPRGTAGVRPQRNEQAREDGPNRKAGELLARMAGGDETALLLLYSQLSGTIYACTLRILGDVEEAKDATEEIFFRLWSRAGRYDPGRCSALAWILTVARRFALDRKRAITRRAKAMRRLHEGGEPVRSGDPEWLHRVDLVSALEQLSRKDRELLESAYFEGLSGSEIARRDDLPLGTVKTRIRAAMGRLRKAFHGVSS